MARQLQTSFRSPFPGLLFERGCGKRTQVRFFCSSRRSSSGEAVDLQLHDRPWDICGGGTNFSFAIFVS